MASVIEIVFKGERVNICLDEDFYGEIFWRKIENHKYEPDTLSFLENNLDSKSVLIDIGAANGAMAILGTLCDSPVYAFEPNPLMFRVASQNIELNKKSRKLAKIYNEAISTTNSEISFKAGTDSKVLSNIVFSETSRNFVNIKVKSLSGVVSEIAEVHKKSNILIKMDIEGAEWKIFNDLSTLETLKEYRVKVLLAVHPGFYRPPNKSIRGINRLNLEIFRIKNILESYKTYKQISKYASISRTNLNRVESAKQFSFLIEAGYHEYIIEF